MNLINILVIFLILLGLDEHLESFRKYQEESLEFVKVNMTWVEQFEIDDIVNATETFEAWFEINFSAFSSYSTQVVLFSSKMRN